MRLCRAQGRLGAHARPLQGRIASSPHRQQDRLRRRPPRRRIASFVRCASPRRLARQRRGAADRGRRAARLDPQILEEALQSQQARRHRCDPSANGGADGRVRARVTLIVSGGTGSGKTTMLNALSAFISEKERLVTIEDAAELQLQQPHVGRMETRPPNIEGKGEIRQRELVKNALRMRPDRVILGECRGEEAFDMLQAMNTGHEGSMATIHANTPRDAISRLEQMIGMAGLPMTVSSIRGQIAAAIRVIVQLQRFSDGKRRVTSIAEITGLESDIIQMQEIYKFVRTSTGDDGKVEGQFQATGVRPRFLGDLAAQGIAIPGNYFDPSKHL